MESFQLDDGHVHVHFAAPQVPPGMRYDPDTLLVLPADAYYAAGRVRVLASVALGVLLFAATLGIGYLAWSITTWGRGQTPAQRLLGLRCWDPEARRVPGRAQMAERQFFGIALSALSSVTALLSFVFMLFSVTTTRGQTSAGDLLLGTIILRDPQGVLLS